MNFSAELFEDGWALGAFALLALVWVWCARTGPWKRLADPVQANVWFGTIVALIVVWHLNAGVRPGLGLHLLGATAFTLMFGRQLAIVGLCIVLAAVMLNGGAHALADWQPYALSALVTAVFPCFAAHAVLRATERFLPANFFVYIFVAAFFGAAAVVVATGVVASLLLWVAAVYPFEMLAGEYLPPYLLLGFAEAWLNGAAITLMVVYHPHWVGSFDDHRYLHNK